MYLNFSVLTKEVLLHIEALKVSVVVAGKLKKSHGYIPYSENVQSCQNLLGLSGKYLN